MGTYNVAYDICRRYIHDYRPNMGDDLADKILGYLRSRNIKALTSLIDQYNPAYHGVDVYRHLMQIEAFFKKNASFAHADGCEEAALCSFHQAETFCKITNKRLEFYYLHSDRQDPRLKKQISRMQRYISNVLGDFSTFLGNLPEHVKVTSGATATRSRKESQPYRKIRPNLICTPSAKPYLEALIRFYGAEPRVRTKQWNRVVTVPKNWKTHRTIAAEPEGNLPLQLAFDSYVKRRLRRFGIDLSDQSQNQDYACKGSILGHLATLDLSMASDTMSFNTVALLLPVEWFDYLNAVRVKYGKLPDGSFLEYAKFSSMGNGATFALESLIFAAACYAVRPKVFSVYGDDIIIDTFKYDEVTRLLRYIGFRVNEDKSYNSTPFRESCGGNFFDGQDVTPFYLRFEPKHNAEVSHIVNGCVAIGLPEGEVWNWCRTTAEGLLKGPYSEDSTSYVFIDVESAYSRRYLRSTLGISKSRDLRKPNYQHPIVQRYLPVTKTKRISDSRTLFLWFLYRKAGLRTSDLWKDATSILRTAKYLRWGDTHFGETLGALVTSLQPNSRHTYVRKWVGWYPPAAVTPVHLFWWTEYLFARKG